MDMDVEEIIFVAKNGAGTTTPIRRALGLPRAKTGSVRVFGPDPVADPIGVLERRGFEVVEMSACSVLAPAWEEKLAEIQASPEQWQELRRMELEACREPGCLDTGTHLIAVGRKRAR